MQINIYGIPSHVYTVHLLSFIVFLVKWGVNYYYQISNIYFLLLLLLGIAKSVQISIIKKIMNIAVRSTYYIFCRRNKAWTDPALLHF